MLKLLRKVVHAVTTKHSQFVPLYTELYHYYETHLCHLQTLMNI